ncbi:RNase A-like domain-containing protein [Jatrophihabitans sp.]|uniref:RNase A-like domain-containing protein n=1 Tax=Jatrophihabitans sp. TaxID=1932789 RepID=UPI002BF51A87|nr:RNase A-like domain-containing protein [Jatrophihabitans sp.]
MATERFLLPADPRLAARLCLDQRMPAGDPVRLRLAARRAGSTAEDLRRTSAVLLATVDSTLWSGPAHQAFAEQIRTHTPLLSATAERYEHYAGLLGTYAAALEETAPRLTATRSRLQQRWEELAAHGLSRELASPAGLGSSLGGPQPDAAAELLPLARDFKACYDRWADALDRCLLALRQAGEADPTRDRHGLRAFGQHLADAAHQQLSSFERAVLHPSLRNLSDCLGTLNADLSVLGLGLLLICPPAATACLVAATVLAAARLAVDATRRAQGEQVSNTGLAMELAAAIPVGGGAVRSLRAADDVVHLVPGGGLLAHEGVENGHTLAKHVGKSPEFLRHRLATEPNISGASTFFDREVAERAISAVLHDNRGKVATWLATSKRELILTGRMKRPVGIVISEDSIGPQDGRGIRLLIRRSPALGIGFRIHTAMVTID